MLRRIFARVSAITFPSQNRRQKMMRMKKSKRERMLKRDKFRVGDDIRWQANITVRGFSFIKAGNVVTWRSRCRQWQTNYNSVKATGKPERLSEGSFNSRWSKGVENVERVDDIIHGFTFYNRIMIVFILQPRNWLLSRFYCLTFFKFYTGKW